MKKLLAITTAATLLASALPAFAASNDIVVRNTNSAAVTNTLSVAASTGNNVSSGASAANSVTGGNVWDSNYDNQAGNGGSTVAGGNGGTIVTGDATAVAEIGNDLNTSITKINATPWAVGDIRVRNDNSAAVMNVAAVAAVSDLNTANGSTAANSTVGGNIDNSGSSNTAGNVGSNVRGGNGGSITTGNSSAAASVVNVLNWVVTRIRK